MLGNLIHGCLAMVGCLSIQCVVISVLLDYLIRRKQRGGIKPTLTNIAGFLIVAMLTIMVGTFCQIAVWAWLFVWHEEFQSFADAFYHSMVNYTALGYGDIVMSEERRLLGALEATNGVLMLGISTAFLYSIMGGIIDEVGRIKSTESTQSSDQPENT